MDEIRGKAMKRILIVDDEKHMREMLQEMTELSFGDICPVLCEDALHAITEIQANPEFQAVVTDWNMPFADGSWVVKAALAAGIPAKRVAVMTGSGVSPKIAQQNIERALSIGIGGTLLKPFMLEQWQQLLVALTE
jgi:CheY-like chemotaxis protein